jgi:hypothetical protein
MIAEAEQTYKKRGQYAPQKSVMKTMTAKEDTNRDGKLDEEERAKISAEEKETMKKAGLSQGKRKSAQSFL